MELLLFILFNTTLCFIGARATFDFVLINFFLKLVYSSKQITTNNDPILILTNIFGTLLRLFIYECSIIINNLEETKYGGKIISLYNTANTYFIMSRKLLFKYIFSNIFNILFKNTITLMNEYKTEVVPIETNKELKTKQDIDSFISKLQS